MLEEFQTHLDEARKKRDESEEKADRASRLLAQVKNGVDHLTEKLQHIKAVSSPGLGILQLISVFSLNLSQPHTHMLRPKLSPDSEEYILEQLSSVEQKLVSVTEELASRDLDTIHKEMEDEEVDSNVVTYWTV